LQVPSEQVFGRLESDLPEELKVENNLCKNLLPHFGHFISSLPKTNFSNLRPQFLHLYS